MELAALVCVFAGLALLRLDPRIPPSEEAARHWTAAGTFLGELGLRVGAGGPGAPVAPAAAAAGPASPAYHAALAVARGLGGGWAAAKAVSLLAASLALLAWALYARRRLGTAGGLAVAFALAASPLFGAAAVGIGPDAWALLAWALACQGIARWEETGQGLATGVAGLGLAAATSPAGLLGAAAFGVSLAGRGRRPAAAAAAVALVLVLGLWLSRGCGPGAAACLAGLHVDAAHPDRGWLGPGPLLQRALGNALAHVTDALPAALAGTSAGPIGALGRLAALAVLALGLVGLADGLVHWRHAEWSLAGLGLAALAVPPERVAPERWLPALPILVVTACAGLARLREHWPAARGRARAWTVPAATALAALAIPHTLEATVKNQACLRSAREGDRWACYDDGWRGLLGAALWARRHLPADARVLAPAPHLFGWVAARTTAGYPRASDAETFWRHVDATGARYLVLDGVHRAPTRPAVAAIRAAPDRVRVVHREGRPPTTVLRVLPAPRP